MSEPAVITSYVITYAALLGYASWLHFRHRRATRRE